MMKWFKRLKVGSKLIFGFSIMIFITVAVAYMGFNSVENINTQLENIFSVRMPGIDYLIQADRDLQQLLVAERSMVFTNTKSEAFKVLAEDYEGNLKQADERFAKYKALDITPEEKAIIPKYEKAREEWKVISKKVVDGRKADTRQGRREALDLTMGLAKEKFEEMRNYIDQLTNINLGLAEKAHGEAVATYKNTLLVLLSFGGLGLLIGIFLTWIINQGVTKPLRIVIERLTEASDQVATGSNEVSSSSQSLAEGSSEQAASIEETSSSLEEMSSMTKQNADNAGQADNLMKEANQVVGQANSSMNELTTSMEEISKASEETSKIIKTIDEIAFQTNLLALNAAVEAARAGEAGAGFAVVADEVRNLAMRAADAARNTADLIEGTVKKVSDGSELVTKTNEAFIQVTESAKKVGELVGEIAAASNEQADGIGQINKAVTEMDKVVQQNAASAEESASASEEMSAQAEQMKASVGHLVAMVGKSEKRKGLTIGKIKESEVKNNHPPVVHASQAHDTGKRLLTIHKKNEISPDKVLPTDNGFQDF